jgi:hypothetical protein
MRVDLAEAVSAIEEVNRVKSFANWIAHVQSVRIPFHEVMELIRREINQARAVGNDLAKETCYAYIPSDS